MRTVRTAAGPFAERPFYTDDEIERMCSDALAETGLMPREPGVVRIERFIEKRFNNAPVIYERLPAKVLGFTEFGPNGVQAIHIAETSDTSSKSEARRINSTLAHEAGHGLMHTHLFALGLDHGGLFGNDPDVSSQRVLCRDEENQNVRSKRRYDGRWWEFQANRAIGALLMPKEIFLLFMKQFVEERGTFGLPRLSSERRNEAIAAAANMFDVNPAAARIRVDGFFSDASRQLTL
jgi:hypothetical protein